MCSRSFLWLLSGVVLLGASAHSSAIGPGNVLVLYNTASSAGAQIAADYAAIYPGVRLLGLNDVPVTEEVTQDVYLELIRPHLIAALDSSIDCIVTTKGLPLRIENTDPGGSTVTNIYSSLESELVRVDTIDSPALMGNQQYMLPEFMGGNSLALNPYNGVDAPFSYQQYGIRLTSRLDGFSASDVRQAVLRGRYAVTGLQEQRYVLDDDPDAPASSADRIGELHNLLTEYGLNSVYNGDNTFVQDVPGTVLGYVSHGRYGGPEGYLTDPVNGIQFDLAAGAVFYSWESYNAYSFEPGGNVLGQGLIAEWLARGGTAGVGQVEEPGANNVGVAHEPTIFEALLEGRTWAEAAWSATMQLSFVNTVVGDPLMRWRRPLLGDSNIDGRVDVMDLGVLATNFGRTGVGWRQGDFTGDGIVNVYDLAELADNYGEAGGSLPEPATALLAALAGGALLRRRRRP